MPTIARHISVVRRCLGADDAVLLVARCARPDRPLAGEHVMVLTQRRLVVTREQRLTRRPRLHLDAPIHELSQVTWRREPDRGAVELVANAIDGVRERFRIKPRRERNVWPIEEAFGYVFQAGTRVVTQTPVHLAPVHVSNVVRTAS